MAKPLSATMIRTLKAVAANGGEMSGYAAQGTGFHCHAADGAVKRGLLAQVQDCDTCVANKAAEVEFYATTPRVNGYVVNGALAAFKATLPACEKGDAAGCYLRVRLTEAGRAAVA